MLKWLVSLFIASQSWMGVVRTPQEASPVWTIESAWSGESLQFVAQAKIADLQCNDGKVLKLPMVLYGQQQLVFGDKILNYNEKGSNQRVFNQPIVNCDVFQAYGDQIVTWRVFAYSEYFSMVSSWPEIHYPKIIDHLSNTIYIGATLSLFMFSILILFMLYTRNQKRFIVSLSLSSFFTSMYFLLSSADKYGINWDILTINKVADTCASLSFLLMHYCFLLSGSLKKGLFKFIFSSTLVGLSIVFIGSNGDEVQFGTSLQFLGVLLGVAAISFQTLKQALQSRKLQHSAEFLCALTFLSFTTLEMAIFSGTLDMGSYIPVGLIFGYMMFVLSINQKIRQTYRERDELFDKMEEKVKLRTKELSLALQAKDTAQAELVESAKLASLGTLSAGIAHEINNSINYVNSCVFGLERKINEVVPEDHPSHEKIMKLISTIRHGAKMTIDIVSSLRNYTGLNQSKMKESTLDEIVTSVTTIIRSKIGSVEIKRNFAQDLKVYGSISGLNQVLMNLVVNALDVVDKKSGVIEIRGESDGNENVHIWVKDNGSGIPDALQNQIFDPFFTTKDVGSGTGLGLHISKKEIESRHKGTLSLETSDATGTVFKIEIPRNAMHLEGAA